MEAPSLPRAGAAIDRLHGSGCRFTGFAMADQPDPARNRWLALMAIRIVGALGAVFGVVLIGRGEGLSVRLLGFAIVIAALAMAASLSGHLARRWRSPRP